MQVIGAASSSGTGVLVIVYVVVVVLEVIAGWKVFVKAGQPGWGIFIPLYNIYLICKIAGRPGWYLIFLLIPLVNIIFSLLLAIDIAKAFSKSGGFGFGLWILDFVFVPILGFGSAQYIAPVPGY
jgi:hypothetical protein